ncbi:MAG TPA: hypothetical protein VL122_03675 [Nitrospirota bacterium]|nr:hypothetical protein [Nitrospirota bacterium]
MVKVFFSMNNHQVATPEMMLEEARSYIIFFREAKDKISAYIGLHLLLTGRKLYYAHSSNPFPAEELDSVQEEALVFAEGLGAMLDELDFSRLPPGEASRWIEKQDIFKSTPEPQIAPATQAPEAAQSEPPTEQQAPSGPASAAEQATPSQAPVQHQEQQAQPVLTEPQPPSPQQASPQAAPASIQPKPVPAAPDTAPIQRPVQSPQNAPQMPPVQPAPQEALPAAPEVQHPEPAQPAPSLPQRQGMAEEDAEYTHPHEHVPVERKRENQRPPQRTTGAGLQGTQVKPPSRAAGPKPPPSAAPKSRQEMFQQAISSGFVKVPKQAGKKESQPTAGVVSRDREALARLLTSF